MISFNAIAHFIGGSKQEHGFARAGSRERQAGFTLVEMLVVIAIIGLIMGLIGPRVLNYLSESKVKAAKIQLQSFASALDLFFLDAGRCIRYAAFDRFGLLIAKAEIPLQNVRELAAADRDVAGKERLVSAHDVHVHRGSADV